MADGHRVLRLRPVQPRRAPARDAAGQPPGLRRRRRQHARHRLLGRRVRRVQPGPGRRRLRRRRDRRPPAVGAARHGPAWSASATRASASSTSPRPGRRTSPPSRRCRSSTTCGASSGPGGIYNSGFTRAWLAMRDDETKAGGQAWDQARIDAGDEVAARQPGDPQPELRLRALRPGHRALPARASRPATSASVVDRIDVPVYLTGAWQDEQTGSRFALMLDDFTSAPHTRFTLFNGHHPDGYSPMVIAPLVRVPVVPRGPADPAGARDDPDVRPGAVRRGVRLRGRARGRPVRAPATTSTRRSPSTSPSRRSGSSSRAAPATRCPAPPRSATRRRPRRSRHPASRRGAGGSTPTARWPTTAPDRGGADAYLDDLEAGGLAYSSELLSDLQRFTQPQVPITWTRFDDEHRVAYETPPLDRAGRPSPGRATSTCGCGPARPTPRCR